MVTRIDNTVFLEVVRVVDLKYYLHTHKLYRCKRMEVLTNFIMVIILQSIRVSNHHIVHLKLIYISVNNISEKLKKKSSCHQLPSLWEAPLGELTPHFFRSLILDRPVHFPPSACLPSSGPLLSPGSLPLVSPPAVSAPGGGRIIVNLPHNDAHAPRA